MERFTAWRDRGEFSCNGRCFDIGMTVHAHPTLSEATKEAALAALGRALHF